MGDFSFLSIMLAILGDVSNSLKDKGQKVHSLPTKLTISAPEYSWLRRKPRNTAAPPLLNTKVSKEDGQGPRGTGFDLSSTKGGNHNSGRAGNQPQNKKEMTFWVVPVTGGVRYPSIQSLLVSQTLTGCVCTR